MKQPGKIDLEALLKEADRMKEETLRQFRQMQVEGMSGGGIAKVVMNALHEVEKVTLEPDLIKEGDVEMIEDLIKAAINDAVRKLENHIRDTLGMLPGDQPTAFRSK